MVAIPSVLLFNWLSARLASYEQGLTRARGELVDRLEGSFEPERSESGILESPRELGGAPVASGA